MAEEIPVWGNGLQGIPEDYVEVPTGNVFLTRKIKALAGKVFIRMRVGLRYSTPVALLAPQDVVEAAQAEDVRTEAARLKQRQASARCRAKAEARRKAEAASKVPAPPPPPPEDAPG